MNNRETSPCEGLIDYLAGESSDMERKRFERHLESCPDCKEEASTWREVWNRLSDDVEMIEPPADLKESVLTLLFDNNGLTPEPFKKTHKSRLKRFLLGGASVAVLVSVFAAGWLLRDAQIQSIKKEASVQAPASIETLFRLSAERGNGKFDDSPNAYGVACLVRSEKEEQLVVYIFGSPQTREGEAYQVWLLNDGVRTSAGTFTVGTSGIGIMTLPMSQEIPVFDSVGVTLEPDSHSDSPRGPKMFGSTKASSSGDA